MCPRESKGTSDMSSEYKARYIHVYTCSLEGEIIYLYILRHVHVHVCMFQGCLMAYRGYILRRGSMLVHTIGVYTAVLPHLDQ